MRGVVISVGVIDIGLRFWALRDLARRPSEAVAGPKAVWALGLVSVSSAGVLPLAYLVLGRRSSASGGEVGER
jgi:hypothetical protein